jgi:S1-C subfamily serine protease
MGLPETFSIIRPSVVALGSRFAPSSDEAPPHFPPVFGTGFVIDGRGIVCTNRHVVQILEEQPPGSAIAVVFPEFDETHGQPVLFRGVRAWSVLHEFSSSGPFYGEDLPDIAFVQIDVQGLRPLEFAPDPGTLRIGRSVATAGFGMGAAPIVTFGKVTQLTPLLRHGVISSVYPCPCPLPDGFTIDVMTQGGESGSPVFLPDEPKVVGMVAGGFGNTNITVCLPGHILHESIRAAMSDKLDFRGVPCLSDLLERSEKDSKIEWMQLVPKSPQR